MHDKVDIEPITPKTQGVEITPSNNIDKVVFNDGTIHTDIPSFLFKDEKIFKSIKNKKTKGK